MFPTRTATRLALAIVGAILFADAASLCVRSAYAQGTTQHRVCFDYDLPADAYRDVRIGYHARPSDSARAAWFEARAGRHWLLHLPRSALTTAYPGSETLLLNDVALEFLLRDGVLLSATALVRQAGWHGAPEPIPTEQCRRHGMISGESAYFDRVVIAILSDTFALSHGIRVPPLDQPCEDDRDRTASRRADLDFDGFEACDLTPRPGRLPVLHETVYRRTSDAEPFRIRCRPAKALHCEVESRIDGWNVRVTYDARRKAEWRFIWCASAQYLEQVTVSRTPAVVD